MSLDHSMTFRDMQIRVCERLGIADESGSIAAPTADTCLLDKVKRSIHDATRELWRAVDPRSGQAVRWTFQSPHITLSLNDDGLGASNIGQDAARYRLPRGVVSAPIGRISWYDATGRRGGAICSSSMDEVIRKGLAEPDRTGIPMYCAVGPVQGETVAPGDRPGLEARFFAKPDRDLSVTARFKCEPVRLIGDGDRGNWPAVHDLTVIALAVRSFVGAGGLESAPDPQQAAAVAGEALIASIENDFDARSRTFGRLGGRDTGSRFNTNEIEMHDGTVLTFN